MNGINEMVREIVAKRDALIEEALEKAIQSGTQGVAIIRVDETTEHIGPTSLVPYGQLYEFPSRESFEAYVARL